MDWQKRLCGGRPAAWWDRVFERPPRAADRRQPGACFSCTEGWSHDSVVGDATLYDMLPATARALSMPRHVLVHNVCAFGFETDLLRRLKRCEPFSPGHLMAYRTAEAQALRSSERLGVRPA